MTDIKDLFAEHIRGGEDVYRPPVKVELVEGERIWYLSFDLNLEEQDKLRRLRGFGLTTDKLPFGEGLELLLKLNNITYQAKVNMGLGHKDMPADKAKKFCEKYYAMQQGFPEDITVVTPENASLHLRAHNQPGENRYVLADRIKGNVEEVSRHIKAVDNVMFAYNVLHDLERLDRKAQGNLK